MYSTGSSIAISLAGQWLLIRSIIAASVVLLPLPVVPVTSVSPRLDIAISLMTGGRFSSAMVGMRPRTMRMAMPLIPRFRYAEQRNRDSPGSA
jgi:hypothetical protein